MSTNAFFNFIEQMIEDPISMQKLHESCGLVKENCQLKKDKNNIPYYFIKVPFDKSIDLGNFKLLEHHISIYEKLENKSISEYHYTASFKDKEHREWRVHIFYDPKDEPEQEPVLSIRNKKEFVKQSTTALNEQLIQLAEAARKKFIDPIRQLQTQKLHELEVLQEFAWSEIRHFKQNPGTEKNYLQIIKKQREIISTLNILCPKEIYQTRLNYLTELQSKVTKHSWSIKPQIAEESAKSEIADKPSSISFFPPATTKTKPNKHKKNSAPVMSPLKKIQKNIKESVEDTKGNGIDWCKLNEVLLDMNQELMFLSDTSMLPEELIEFRRIQEAVEKVGKEQLLQWIEDSSEQAQQLSALFPLVLNESLFINSLVTLNSYGIELFLQHNKTFNINSFQPIIGDKKYSSILAYLEELSWSQAKQELSDRLPLFVCLEVLLCHGMSILQESKGVLFPLLVILDNSHPLRSWFLGRVGNPLLEYKVLSQFVTQLELRREKLPADFKFHDSMEKLIKFFKLHFETYHEHHGLTTAEHPKSMLDTHLFVFRNLGLDKAIKFAEHPDVIKSSKTLSASLIHAPYSQKARLAMKSSNGELKFTFKTPMEELFESIKGQDIDQEDLMKILVAGFVHGVKTLIDILVDSTINKAKITGKHATREKNRLHQQFGSKIGKEEMEESLSTEETPSPKF